MIDINVTHLLNEMSDRRWFSRRDSAPTSAHVLDQILVDDGPPPLVLTLIEVVFEDGYRDLYHVPLLIEEDGGARDAFDEPRRLGVLGGLLADGHPLPGAKGSVQFGGPGLDPLAPPGTRSVRAMGVEQTNSSCVFDEAIILKLFRRVQEGPNPDIELTRSLTNAGFPHIPAHVGELTYVGTPHGETAEIRLDLGIAQRFIAEGSEGWDATLRRLNVLFDEVDPADAHEDMRVLTEERAVGILGAIDQLGDATASLHVALSRDEDELNPEPVEPADLKEWTDQVRTMLTRLVASGVSELAEVEEAVAARIEALSGVTEPGLKIRVHGDYHLGQVLHSSRGWMILDFEGEPARSVEERRHKHSPLKDVAGMLRSFGYAAMSALFQRGEPGGREWERLEPWANMWETLARERFLHSYFRKSHEGRFLPADRDEATVMLDFFEIDKALYEIGYESSHRPEWLRIPVRGIHRLLDQSS